MVFLMDFDMWIIGLFSKIENQYPEGGFGIFKVVQYGWLNNDKSNIQLYEEKTKQIYLCCKFILIRQIFFNSECRSQFWDAIKRVLYPLLLSVDVIRLRPAAVGHFLRL